MASSQGCVTLLLTVSAQCNARGHRCKLMENSVANDQPICRASQTAAHWLTPAAVSVQSGWAEEEWGGGGREEKDGGRR